MKFKVGDKVKIMRVLHGAPESTVNEVGVLTRAIKYSSSWELEVNNLWVYTDKEVINITREDKLRRILG